ncbi:hypothetical protein [Lacinutrix sp.]|uniref:hypothetical protein n=1 Tax=Lacinutrix sp. TaxID=1937692 RepID=UPI0025C53DBD|nr:hypothetical protein [Lacinutrix sp.]
MKIITILFFSILLNACGATEAAKTSLNESVNTQPKLVQENFKIEYTTQSRGSFNKIILENKTVSFQNGHSSKPVVTSCSEKDWDDLMATVSELNLKGMNILESPSKAHQYDGAAAVNLNVIKNNESYRVPTFDEGKPNKEIETLINLVIKIADTTKEKN